MSIHQRSATPVEALRRHFGHQEFRPGQEEIILSILSRNDTLVVMPTGGGKSLCYQIPALLLDGVAVVVSPLIALMKDQVDALARQDVRATTINSTLEFPEVRQRMTDIRYGLYSLVYVAPERFDSPSFVDLMSGLDVSLFAVDEAHCISEWGHDFRPSYTRLREAAEAMKRPPIIALTATATPYVQEDIIAQLGLKAPRRFVRGFDRPNLSYGVLHSRNKEEDLRRLMKQEMERPGVSIVYCGTRKSVEQMGMMLHAERFPVTIYHAGLADQDRRRAQESFIAGEVRVIVATNAFGMGIDKPDVRHVIHADMPGSIEAYYQEAGRGGRDGLPSDCTLLYSERDRRLQEFFIQNAFPDRGNIELVYDALWDMVHVGVGNRYEGVFVPDEKVLAARSKVHGAAITGIIQILERNNLLRRIKAERLGSVRIIATSNEIQDYYRRTRDPDRQKTILALLRTLGGAALGQQILFNPDDVSLRHGVPADVFDRSMRALMASGLLAYTPPTPGTGYQFLTERQSARRIVIDEKAIVDGRNRALLKLDAMERYTRTATCRRNFILEYFHAEHESGTCGRCDVCRSGGATVDLPAFGAIPSRPATTRAAELLLAAAEELGGRFGKMTLVDVLRGGTSQTIERFNLSTYPRYGDLREMGRRELALLVDSLLQRNLLESSAGLHPTVRITTTGLEEIRDLSLTRWLPPPRGGEFSRNPDILARLRSVRDEIAARDGMRPNRLCPEEVLIRISNALPTSRNVFLAIDGTTQELWNVCGGPFLSIVEPTLAEGMEDDFGGLPDRLRKTLSLIEQGYALREIAHRAALQPSTISTHVEELMERGVEIDATQFVPSGLLRSVAEEVSKRPRATLRELRALLGGAIEYPELRIAVAAARKGLAATGG